MTEPILISISQNVGITDEVNRYYQPLEGIMPMHCSANVGKDGDSALFFGLGHVDDIENFQICLLKFHVLFLH